MANMAYRALEIPTEEELRYNRELNDWLSAVYEEVTAATMYEYMFDGALEEEWGDGRGNLHVYIQKETDPPPELGEDGVYRGSRVGGFELIDECQGKTFAVSSPITYWGKSGKSKYAHDCCGFIIDLDDVKIDALRGWALDRWSDKPLANFKEVMDKDWFMPLPTFMVSTGHGLHLVYVIEKPVRLFHWNIKHLADFKAYLTGRLWIPELTEQTRQVQYVFQQYRVPGSKTKFGEKVRAYRTGPVWELRDLYTYTGLDYGDIKQVDEFRRSRKMTLAEAERRYPNWFLRRGDIDAPPKTWVGDKDVYYWWRDKILPEHKQNGDPYVSYGHRYYSIYALGIFAVKCGIEYDELERDAYALKDYFNSISPEHPFEDNDIEAALDAGYKPHNMRFPYKAIKRYTQIFPPEKKRNYREQGRHLRLARKQLAELIDMGEVKVGRPKGTRKSSTPKSEEIRRFAAENPGMSNRQIAEALGVSRNTVNKWMKSEA